MRSTADSRSQETGRRREASQERHGLEELAERLDAIARRARSEVWPGWTDVDERVIVAAAREVRAIPEALSAEMKEAFDVGREYGHMEEHLVELKRELTAVATFLARQAWGGGRPGHA